MSPRGRAVAEALAGAYAEWVGITAHDDPGERNALAVLDSERAVRDFVPDLGAIAALPAGGLIVTARGRAGNRVVSRYFAPAYGIPEDPVTGSVPLHHWPLLARSSGNTPRRRTSLAPRGDARRRHDR